MEKRVIRDVHVPKTGVPFNLCVVHKGLGYVSDLPPFREDFWANLRTARERRLPLPTYIRKPIKEEEEIIMNHLQLLLEECWFQYKAYVESGSLVTRPVGASALRRGLSPPLS